MTVTDEPKERDHTAGDRARDIILTAIFNRRTIAQAADEASVNYSTAWRVLQRPDVRAELAALRAERQRVISEQLIENERYLASAAPNAIRILIELATNKPGKVPYYVQCMAADRLLGHSVDLHRSVVLDLRLAELTDAVEALAASTAPAPASAPGSRVAELKARLGEAH